MTAEDIRALREETGVGVLICKKALELAEDDRELAKFIIQNDYYSNMIITQYPSSSDIYDAREEHMIRSIIGKSTCTNVIDLMKECMRVSRGKVNPHFAKQIITEYQYVKN